MFKVGDRLVCINNSDIDSILNAHASKLKLNKVYIIKKCLGDFIKIDNNINYNYRKIRFVLLTESRKQKIKKIRYVINR